MEYILTITEEQDIYRLLVKPYLLHIGNDLKDKVDIAKQIFLKTPEDVLLVESYGFTFDSILAGLTEKQIEYLVKNYSIDGVYFADEFLYPGKEDLETFIRLIQENNLDIK